MEYNKHSNSYLNAYYIYGVALHTPYVAIAA